ncbi:MAG TPA: hypothetical protein VHC39_02345 [Rhizomicrobium sp.]|nr:hypothetical protein [Rhizomicrobium sp.]
MRSEDRGNGDGLTPAIAGRMLALLCAIAATWLATHPYFGVIHDSRFYMVEVLRNLNPTHFAGDLYFQFGSQGSFSLFTHLYQPFVSRFGLGAASMGFAVAGEFFWVFALFCLARRLTGERYLWLSIFAVIATSSQYAFFRYGEFFVTPRLFAEALTMLALALLRSRPAASLVLLGVSAALHPLMTLPGLVAVYVYFAFAQPLWWLALPAATALAAALGWAHVQPFANLFQTIDPAWFSVIQIRSPQCLLANLPLGDLLEIVGAFFWTGVAAFLTRGQERRFLLAIWVTGAAGLACAFLGSDLARNVFITELQPWRAAWLLKLVSRICLPMVIAIPLGKSAMVAKRNANPFAITVLVTMSIILVLDTVRLIQMPYDAGFSYLSFAFVIAALMVICVELLLTDKQYRYIRGVSLGLAVVLVCMALSRWDMRTPWTKFLEAPAPPPRDLTAMLPANASIYWEGSVEMPWLRLKRADYYSCEQGTGVVFHRQTAMTYEQRTNNFAPFRLVHPDSPDTCLDFDSPKKPDRTRGGLAKLCRKEPGLDYLVMLAPIPGVRSRVWKSPARFEDARLVNGKPFVLSADRFYIYSCSDLR